MGVNVGEKRADPVGLIFLSILTRIMNSFLAHHTSLTSALSLKKLILYKNAEMQHDDVTLI